MAITGSIDRERVGNWAILLDVTDFKCLDLNKQELKINGVRLEKQSLLANLVKVLEGTEGLIIDEDDCCDFHFIDRKIKKRDYAYLNEYEYAVSILTLKVEANCMKVVAGTFLKTPLNRLTTNTIVASLKETHANKNREYTKSRVATFILNQNEVKMNKDQSFKDAYNPDPSVLLDLIGSDPKAASKAKEFLGMLNDPRAVRLYNESIME